MLETILIDRALCLPAVNIAALLKGQLIAVIPQVFVQKGWTFALYPTQTNNDLYPEQQYRSHILPLVEDTPTQQQTEVTTIEVWARCEYCKVVHDIEHLEALSHLTIWTKEALREVMEQRQHLFVALLRVYQIPTKIQVSNDTASAEKLGKFVSISTLNEQSYKALNVREMLPVLNDAVFNRRKHQAEALHPPLYPELEELQHTIAPLVKDNAQLQGFNLFLQKFLGWTDGVTMDNCDPALEWISTIAKVGNSSEGHKFEKLVRKGLLKLGFTGSSLGPSSTGGPGGMDFYCEEPYSMVGECKATKTETVYDGTPAQLLKIGMNHLGKEQYERSIKLIVAAGDLNFYALRTATENEMNVISPETLQELVNLQTKHKGSINLIELKKCLEQNPFGLADEKVIAHISRIRQNLRIRSHLIASICQLGETEVCRTQFEVIEIRVQYNANFAKIDGSILDNQKVYDLLIELSSPLTGYLGRIEGGTGMLTDRFYFLRDLNTD